MEEIQKVVPPNDEILWSRVKRENQLAPHACAMGVFLALSCILLYLFISGPGNFFEDGLSLFMFWAWSLSCIGLVCALGSYLKTRVVSHATIKQLWTYTHFKVLTKRYWIENGYYLKYPDQKKAAADLEKSALIEQEQNLMRVPLQKITAMEISLFSVPDDPSTSMVVNFYTDPNDLGNHPRSLFSVSFELNTPRFGTSEFDEFWNKLALCFRWEEILSSPSNVKQSPVGEMLTSPSEIFSRRLSSNRSVMEFLNPFKLIRKAFQERNGRRGLGFLCSYQNST